jgi:polyphosphate kinase 2 (PPK2 family)
MLEKQRLPLRLLTKKIWDRRFDSIRDFERHLAGNGVVVLKFFLNVSKGEQLKRFMERLDNPDKNWKFSATDAKERGHWDEYMKAYESLIQETATEKAPWYVVPADNKWFTRIVVASVMIDALASLDMDYPRVTRQKLKDFEAARKALLAQK